jgi:DNA-binding NtrC family response regulator
MDRLNDSVTILLIEDDSSTAEMLRPALEKEGYRVHHSPATPSAQALTQLRPDLLVIDLRPEDQTATWQVVREVETRSVFSGVPMIVYGGDGAYVTEGDVRTLSRATAVLARPVRLDTLLPLVSHALSHRRNWRMDVPFLPSEPLPESAWGW